MLLRKKEEKEIPLFDRSLLRRKMGGEKRERERDGSEVVNEEGT